MVVTVVSVVAVVGVVAVVRCSWCNTGAGLTVRFLELATFSYHCRQTVANFR